MAQNRGKHFAGESGDDAYDSLSAPRASKATDLGQGTGFVPIVGDAEAGRGRKKGRRNSRYVETDPYDLSGRRSRDPRKKAGRIISALLFIVGVALLIVAGVMWGKAQWDYHEQDVETKRLAAYATISDDPATAPVVDWGKLRAVNDDVVAWVQIPGTVVNFPVYQAADNDYYLHTNAEGDYSLGGQVFLDYQNAAPGMADAQSIIYGHHLRNGAMFKPIADMDNQEAFDSVSTVWYVTESANYELEPLLLYYTDEADENVRQFNFESPEAFRAYLDGLLAKSKTSNPDAATIIQGTDHVLTFATCNYVEGSGRTILLCVPKSEADAARAAAGATQS